MRLAIRALSYCRPRISTLIVLSVVVALIALANVSYEISLRRLQTTTWPPPLTFSLHEPQQGDPFGGMLLYNKSYGWPLLWRQSVMGQGMAGPLADIGRCQSAARLAGDVAVWLAILAGVAGGCEWLLRRHPVRFRWNLRTMLTGVALLAACCAWFASARNRANAQDPILDETTWGERSILMERWGPQWFKVVGVDRFCRRIVGISSKPALYNTEQARAHRERLLRLKRLPDLQYLFCYMDAALPEALAELRQLKVLSIGGLGWEYDRRVSKELLAAIGKMAHLEHLHFESMTIDNESAARLAGLESLKSLSLNSVSIEGREWDADPPLLAYVPALRRLESLDVHQSDVNNHDLPRLVEFPGLKSLNLAFTEVTGVGFAKLPLLGSLEELAVDSYALAPEGLAALLGLPRLRKLHVNNIGYGRQPVGAIALDNGGEFEVPESDLGLYRRTLDALRRSHAGMVIDDDVDAAKWDEDRKVSSQYPPHLTPHASRGGFLRSWRWRRERM